MQCATFTCNMFFIYPLQELFAQQHKMKCTKTCLTIQVYLQNMYWMDYLGIDTDHDSGEAREKNTERLYIRCIP